VFAIGGSKETWVGTCRILNKFKLGVGAWIRVKKRGKNIFVYFISYESHGNNLSKRRKKTIEPFFF
jgi:hypothetical protein